MNLSEENLARAQRMQDESGLGDVTKGCADFCPCERCRRALALEFELVEIQAFEKISAKFQDASELATNAGSPGEAALLLRLAAIFGSRAMVAKDAVGGA